MKSPARYLGLAMAALWAVGCEAEPDEGAITHDEEQAMHMDALFFAKGPKAEVENLGCPGNRGIRRAWPQRSLIHIRVAPSAQQDPGLAMIRVVASEMAAGTGGELAVEVTPVDSEDHAIQLGEVLVVSAPPDQVRVMCGADVRGCASSTPYNPGSLHAGRVTLTDIPGAAAMALVAHEFGHALLGLCHISTAEDSIMQGYGRLSPRDEAALRAARAAGLGAWSTREDFVREGLLPAEWPPSTW